MRNRNVAAYRKHVGVSADTLQAMEARVRKATQKYKSMEAGQLRQIEEEIRAAEDLAKAEEELALAKERALYLQQQRGKR